MNDPLIKLENFLYKCEILYILLSLLLVITNAQLQSINSELRFCVSSNSAFRVP